MDEVKLQRDKMLKKGEKILLDAISYSPKYDQCQDGFLRMMTNRINPGVYILPDHAVKDEWRIGGFLATDYAKQDKKSVEETDIKLIHEGRAVFTAIPGLMIKQHGLSYDHYICCHLLDNIPYFRSRHTGFEGTL